MIDRWGSSGLVTRARDHRLRRGNRERHQVDIGLSRRRARCIGLADRGRRFGTHGGLFRRRSDLLGGGRWRLGWCRADGFGGGRRWREPTPCRPEYRRETRGRHRGDCEPPEPMGITPRRWFAQGSRWHRVKRCRRLGRRRSVATLGQREGRGYLLGGRFHGGARSSRWLLGEQIVVQRLRFFVWRRRRSRGRFRRAWLVSERLRGPGLCGERRRRRGSGHVRQRLRGRRGPLRCGQRSRQKLDQVLVLAIEGSGGHRWWRLDARCRRGSDARCRRSHDARRRCRDLARLADARWNGRGWPARFGTWFEQVPRAAVGIVGGHAGDRTDGDVRHLRRALVRGGPGFIWARFCRRRLARAVR
jgi:hypothetical protein